MSSGAAHWSPAVTELVQLVRTRWRENCFVGTKKRFQLCFETRGPRQMCGTCCFAPNICSSLPWWLGFIPGLPRIGNSAGFFILSQLPAWAKKAPRTCRKRGAGPLSDRKSQSIVRLSKDQGGSFRPPRHTGCKLFVQSSPILLRDRAQTCFVYPGR